MTMLEQSLRALLELHRLLREGREDDPEADEIRDSIDRPWHELTWREQDLLAQVSLALYEAQNRGKNEAPAD